MFSNTAYEALYQMLGLALHARFIEIITGESFFRGAILLIFGVGFFVTLLEFVSRHVPGSLVQRRHVPLSRFVRLVACLFLGLAILRVGTTAEVEDYQGKNWADNPYVKNHFHEAGHGYRVSAIFELLSGTAEELTALLSRVIDDLFAKGGSALSAPDIFYKAILYSGAASIEDQGLRDQIRFYTDECFTKVIPSVERFEQPGVIDYLYAAGKGIETELDNISLTLGDGQLTTCLRVRQSTIARLNEYVSEKTGAANNQVPISFFGYEAYFDYSYARNYETSMALVNYYADQKEGRLGIMKGSELPGAAGGIFQTLNRVFSWDGLLGLVGYRDAQGASEAAKRAQEFSEHLARAPHVAGFVRMILVAIFPWLMFFVVAGHWRVLLIWFSIYFSVLLWTPLWTLLYHVMLGIAMSSETLEAFGRLSDGVSLYSAALVNHRLYYMYSIYSWLQLFVATATTGSVFMFLKPMIGAAGGREEAPEFLGTAQGVGGTGADLAQVKSVAGVAEVLL